MNDLEKASMEPLTPSTFGKSLSASQITDILDSRNQALKAYTN